PEGTYYISWYRGRKLMRLSVGKDAADATARRMQKEAELADGVTAPLPSTPQSGLRSLAGAIVDYLDEIRLSKKPKTYGAYSTALTYFQESCHKLYVSDVERKDMLKFAVFLRDEKEQSPRSVYNKFENVMTFLKGQGALKKNKKGVLTPAGVDKNDWPQFT